MTAHPLKLDHLVIAARTLEEGARFVAAKLGVEPAGGGAHPLMRTHNRLLNLFGGVYLEVIAIDPDAPPAEAPRSRLFALDDPALLRRLEDGPQLVHWVARVDRPKGLARWQAQYPERIAPVVAMSRGTNRWGLTAPDDGAFPAWQGAGDGVAPSLIQWDTPAHPSSALPQTGIALVSLTGFHPRAGTIAEQLAWLGAAHLMRVLPTSGAPALVARFELPGGGIVTIGQSAESVEEARRIEADAANEANEAKKPRRRTKSRKADDEAETPAGSQGEATQPDEAQGASSGERIPPPDAAAEQTE